MRKIDQEELADKIFEAGIVRIGLFKLKMHENNPAAPLSPFYIGLKMPPKGNLTKELVIEIGRHMYELSVKKGLIYEYAIGVPNGGSPLAVEFVNASNGAIDKSKLLFLEKKEKEGKREIISKIHGKYAEGGVALPIEDVVSGANSLVEGIKAVRDNGLKVANCVAFVDREQGGRERLEKLGVRLETVFTITQLLSIYVEKGRVSKEKQEEILKYIKEVKAT